MCCVLKRHPHYRRGRAELNVLTLTVKVEMFGLITISSRPLWQMKLFNLKTLVWNWLGYCLHGAQTSALSVLLFFYKGHINMIIYFNWFYRIQISWQKHLESEILYILCSVFIQCTVHLLPSHASSYAVLLYQGLVRDLWNESPLDYVHFLISKPYYTKLITKSCLVIITKLAHYYVNSVLQYGQKYCMCH